MKVESLKELESAFSEWRARKKHAREPAPEDLLARARRAAQTHGLTAVVRATRVERARLFRDVGASADPLEPGETRRRPGRTRAAARDVPTFSRLELSAAAEPIVRPLAEVTTGAGVRLRVFEETPELLRLLSAALGFGGAR